MPETADAQVRVEPVPIRHALASVEDRQIDQMLDAMVDLAPPLPVEIRIRLAYLLGRHRPAPPEPRHDDGPDPVARRDS